MRLVIGSNGHSPVLKLVAVSVIAMTVFGCNSPAATSSAPAASAPAASPTSAPVALKDLAGTRYFGTAVNGQLLSRDATYTKILNSQFSQVTPENAMKWGPVEPQRGTFDWSDADALVASAQANRQKVRGHTLVWHSQLPTWLTGGTFDKAQLDDILKQHIATEVGRYAGKIYAWDVVNEAFNDDGTMRASIWETTLGDGYVADAFRWAHAADPSAKLYINDYDVEGMNPKSDGLYALVKKLKADGVPIDGVGFQSHLDTTVGFPAQMTQNLQRFADLGVDVAVTELDVRVPVPSTAASLKTQADWYKQVVQACVSISACVGITLWGISDRDSWVPAVFPGLGDADLYDQNMRTKPAYDAVVQALEAGSK